MQGSPQGKYVIFGNFRDSTSEYSPLSSQLLSTFLQSVSLECGLDSIPTHSTNKLHKTVYKTVNFPWSSQYLNLDRLACAWARSDSPNSLKTDHQTVCEMVEASWSASFWSVWCARGLVRIPPNSMKMVHKTAFKMVKALWSSQCLILVRLACAWARLDTPRLLKNGPLKLLSKWLRPCGAP
ncbi:uncharacterized protein LACBIDRAFT_333638 [Laccaria bicolor S238N-H82]|uniref:Predicted protein n=1 Tax=Laccaria bicolor (strain S238N-H82 / ATCC MYA-4686) TaxID=486041 RepID=B0DWQ9_LACBS|nr:uncharacterized protein LACBIDRAFT_333638 [Laccaria bicolor S238N-H82]EDR00935.1 predicted protein [Laccaria bicolor S238N-H82]|eukprot:XP_001888330.1 predicted protein [Laccaria bicolor S238N-H82]